MGPELTGVELDPESANTFADGGGNQPEPALRCGADPANACMTCVGKEPASAQKRLEDGHFFDARRNRSIDLFNQRVALFTEEGERHVLRLRANPGGGRQA